MRIQDVMKKPVKSIEAGESVSAAMETMRRNRIHHLVVTVNGALTGVVSEGDVRALEAPDDHRVDEVMSAPAVVATPQMTLRKAANLLRGRNVGCLPVVEEGVTCGIVTTSDLLERIGCGSERPITRGKRWILKDRGPRRKNPVGSRGFASH